jgi:hypothetical protein
MTVQIKLDSGDFRYFNGIVTYFAKTGLSQHHTRYGTPDEQRGGQREVASGNGHPARLATRYVRCTNSDELALIR